MPERIDQQVADLVERAELAPELSPGWEARAVARMEGVRPARERPWRRRAAVVAVAVTVVVVCLLATTSGSRRSRQAWGRAFAGLQAAQTLHIVGEVVVDGERFDFEEWRDTDGFYRCEFRQDGELKQLWMTDGISEEIRPPKKEGGSPFWGKGPHRLYLPRMLATHLFSWDEHPAVMATPRREVPSATDFEAQLEGWQQDADGLSHLELTGSTHRTPEGHTQYVLELSGTSPAYIVSRDGKWVSGPVEDTYRVRAVTDPGADRIIALSEEWLEDGRWVNQLQTTLLETDVEIPSHLSLLEDVPPGHVIVRDPWWSRLQRTLATEKSQDWEATLHAIDVNRDGDLFVTFSRRPLPESYPPTGKSMLPVVVTAVNNVGARYELREPQDDPSRIGHTQHIWSHRAIYALPDGQRRVRLSRVEDGLASPRPRTVTITLAMLSPQSGWDRQDITWSNLTLPPRQPGDNLWQDQIEVEAH